MWLPAAVVLVTLVCVSSRHAAAQECRADFDGSGAVEINELIAAVNEALGGCASAPTATPSVSSSPTPTVPPAEPCPWQFDDLVSPSDSFCRYAGTGDSDCTEPYQAETAWTTRGTEVFAIIIADQGVLAIIAERTSPTSADVQSVAFGPDFHDLFTTSGTLSLPSSRAARFSVRGLIEECGTLVHNGEFVGLANPVDAATAATSADPFGLGVARSAPRVAGAAESLRALRAAMR